MAGSFGRRSFLRGLGGAVVAAPFLDTLGWRDAAAESMTPAARLIVMFTHYGCITNRFFPSKSHGELAPADLEATTLAALAPLAHKLLLPRGIRGMNEWTGGLLRGQGNDPHQAAPSFFTCHPITLNSDDPFGFGTSPRFTPKAMGPSLDHVMAQQLSPDGVPLLLRVGGRFDDWRSAISYSAPELQFPGTSLNQVYTALTGLFSPDTLTPDSYRVARGHSVIDVVREDLATLERHDLSQADRHKLAAWKELLHETGGAALPLVCGERVASELGLPAASDFSPLAGDALTQEVSAGLDAADLHSNLVVLASLCNANPVMFLKYPASHKYAGLGATLDSHSLSHRIDNAGFGGPCEPGVLDLLSSIDAYHANKFAHLITLLDSFAEGEGTLLDNTAAVWFQEMSDGLAHNSNNLPIVQAGSATGYFKTGWAINVEDGSDTLSSGNSEYFCAESGSPEVDAAGAFDQLTGTPAEFANAPINKYYCNLMNALGVKAGEDGFAAVGGQAEVTRFGMYDKTEDFIGGGTNPPTIHDPGEFTALRANG